MSGSTSVAASGGGGDGYMAPFTAVQWQELEHQALIYKYLVAGVPVPSDLVLPIRRSLQALSARLLHHPALGYCSYNGKKYDPEPWRCRRTDGKKWRCSKEAFQESKYCERHMNRGRNRSRKPVESQSTSSHSLSTDVTMNSTCGRKGSYQNVGGSTSSSQSLYSITNSGSYDFGNDGSKLQMGSIPYAINSKDLRHSEQVDNQDYTSGVATNSENSWRLIPSQILKQNNSNNSNPMIIDPNPISSKHQHSSSLLPWSTPEETWCPQPISMVHPGFDATNASSSSSSSTTTNGVFLYGYIQ